MQNAPIQNVKYNSLLASFTTQKRQLVGLGGMFTNYQGISFIQAKTGLQAGNKKAGGHKSPGSL